MSWLLVLGSFRLVGAYTTVDGVSLVSVNSVDEVTILNVDPGGKVVSMARLSRGCDGSWRYLLSTWLSCDPLRVAYLLGLKVGYDASARTAPVEGLIATAPLGSLVPTSAR